MLSLLAPMALAVQSKPTVILCHGAFADASSWNSVIPILQRDGYPVIAVQEPLTSTAEDVAATKRAIARAKGPVVLVGHSYGGVVISAAGTGEASVKSLVFVAAIAPEMGEKFTEVAGRFPVTPLSSALVSDAQGFLTIDPLKFRDAFAGDVPTAQTRVMAVTQKPIAGAALGGAFDGEPAWKRLPSWYIVSGNDHAIAPEQERFYAKRINAKTTELRTSHVPFLSQPRAVARVIEEAAG